ncbi:MAG: putative metal-binding motif-containing protein [Myxococcales bacterium]|nr:putative metal-binding motif-containing protein [Myxococcales bacterium]
MLLIRRALVALGAAIVCAPVLTVSCGSKSGLRIGDTDAGPDSGLDAPADVITPDCTSDDDCVSDDLCLRSQCQEGKCTVPVPLECNDEDPCTEDSCLPETGLCDFRELALDQDGDGFKGPRPGFAPGAPGSCGDDCDDTSAKAFPGGTEVCDGVDNNCNGVIDEGMSYVPAGQGDVRVSSLDQIQAGHGGIAWNDQFYAAAYAGQKDAWRTYVKGLNPDGSTKFGDSPITNVPSDTFTGPIVWTGKIFGTAWEDRRDNDYEIYFNRIDANGKKLGPDLRVTNADGFSLHASMIWNGAEFVLIWDDRRNGPSDYRVYGQRIGVEGQLIGGNVELTGPNIHAETPRIAEGEKTIAIAFNMVSPISKKIGMRTLAPDLTSPSPVITLSEDSAVDPTIVWNKDRYVIAYSKRPSIPGNAIWGAVVKEDGTVLIKEKKLTSGANFARTQWLLPLGDRVLMIWADDHDGNYELYSQMMSNELEVISPRKRITNDSSDTIAPVAVFGPEGDVGVLFDDRRTGSWQVYFTRLTCVAGN